MSTRKESSNQTKETKTPLVDGLHHGGHLHQAHERLQAQVLDVRLPRADELGQQRRRRAQHLARVRKWLVTRHVWPHCQLWAPSLPEFRAQSTGGSGGHDHQP